MPLKYLIQDKSSFEDVITYASEEDIFGLDVETNGQRSRFKMALVGISVGFDDFACYIPLTHFEGSQLPLDYVLEKFKPLLESTNTRYVGHNIKFDETVFQLYGINCNGSGDDTYVLNWLLREDAARGTRGLKPLVEQHLGVKMETYEDVINRSRKQRGVDRDYNFARVSLEHALSYAADDAYFTLRLYRLFEPRVQQEGLWNAYSNIERPILKVVREMEWRGLNVDKEYLDYANKRYPEIIQEIEEQIFEAAEESFNLDSGRQLGRILFDKLNIGKNVPRTAKGQYSTDKKTLETYATKHVIVENVLRRKKIKKTWSVFVEGLIPFIQDDGRVHPKFNPSGTVTGRFSGNEPNMQQIQGDEIEEIRVRDFFIPTEGYIFVVGDFGQIELRVMTHFAKDEVAVKAFNSGRDFHSETAREMYELSATEEPTARQRFNAKKLNFGIPYGKGPYSVSEELDLEVIDCKGEECDECGACYINRWFRAFPRVGPYKKAFTEKARQQGYMRTIAGRKRRLPQLRSPEHKIRWGAERQAFNTLCQGSAADIIKLVMVQVAPKLRPLGAHILIQVHDELVLECPMENAQKVVEVLRQTAEYPLNGKNPLRLPLRFDPKIVTHWSKAK